MKLAGKDLQFISRILRDGSGTEPTEDMEFADNDIFKVRCLSISYETYIAIGFNSYVVKIKDKVR